MVRSCGSCGQKNRTGAEHLADNGRCGACKAALPAVAEPLAVNGADFEEILAKSPVPVLVDFWAAWCGPCRTAAPEVARTAHSMTGRAVVVKVDIEKEQALAARFRVQSIPYFIVFAGGRPIRQQAGLVTAAVMEGWLREAGA